VQDDAAQLVTLLLDPAPGERVLDACAAPGGKTTHIAELMDDRGEIVALDRDGSRLETLRENLKRLGIRSAGVRAGDLLQMKNLGTFDKILLDAPCSALGIIRRHPDIRWCRTEKDLERHHQRQFRLLRAASERLRPGGRLVYAVCSTEPEEGESVVDRAEEELPLRREAPAGGFQRGSFRTFPHREDADGFFAAALTRLSSRSRPAE